MEPTEHIVPPGTTGDSSTSLDVSDTQNGNEASTNDASKTTASKPDQEEEKEIKLPQALEKVLALKTARAQQLGVDPDTTADTVRPAPHQKAKIRALVAMDEMEDDEGEEEESNAASKESKNKRRKKKKKRRANQRKMEQQKQKDKSSDKSAGKEIDVDVEYVMERLVIHL